MIAIGGGGYVPARILRYSFSFRLPAGAHDTDLAARRSFLKKPGSPNIPIQAIGLSLYESLGFDPVEEPGTKVTRTQWLDLSSLEMANLIGKSVLIVDEVDDTRTTLEYAVRELQKDVEEAKKRLGRESEKTTFTIFVLHNKDKDKKGELPKEIIGEGKYLAAETVGDIWICYPWESTYVPFFFCGLVCWRSLLISVAPALTRKLVANSLIGTLMSMTAWLSPLTQQ